MSDGAKLLLGSSTAGSAGGNGGQALLLVALPDRRSLPCGLCGPVGPVGCVGLWACGLYKVCPFPPTDGAPPSSRSANSCFLSPENSQLASLERSGLTVLVGNILHRHPRALFDIHLLTTSLILLNINFVVRRNLAQRLMRTKMSVFEMSCVSNVCASFNIRS